MTWKQFQNQRLVVESPDWNAASPSTVSSPAWLRSWTMPVVAAAFNAAALVLIVFDFAGKNEATPWYIQGDVNMLLFVAMLLGLSAFGLSAAGLNALWQATDPKGRTIQAACGANALIAIASTVIAIVLYVVFLSGIPFPPYTPIDRVMLPEQQSEPLVAAITFMPTSHFMMPFTVSTGHQT